MTAIGNLSTIQSIYSSMEASVARENGALDWSNCNCGIPLVNEGDLCERCMKPLTLERISQLRKSGHYAGSVGLSSCSSCNSQIEIEKNFCTQCGTPTIPNPITKSVQGLKCERCGADLAHDQKYCSDCGIEILWPAVGKSHELGNPAQNNHLKQNSRRVSSITAWVLVVVLLSFILLSRQISTNGEVTTQDKQEECFDREMSKMGAFIQPKEWAIKSRLYCQSLYP
jgi:hypothetical protein